MVPHKNTMLVCRRQEQAKELGEQHAVVGDIAHPDTLRPAMQESDKLVM